MPQRKLASKHIVSIGKVQPSQVHPIRVTHFNLRRANLMRSEVEDGRCEQ